jgi:hypothetical protein
VLKIGGTKIKKGRLKNGFDYEFSASETKKRLKISSCEILNLMLSITL